MIIYAGLTNSSVASLFIAGIIPGILVGLGMMLVIYFWLLKSGFSKI